MKARNFFGMGLATAAGMLLVALWLAPAEARIFKYVDEDGRVHYTNDESSIPLKYRTGDGVKRLRSLPDAPAPAPSAPSAPVAGGKGAPAPGGKDAAAPAEPAGMTPADARLVDRSLGVLKKGVEMVQGFEGAQYNFTNGRRLVNSIQLLRPEKEQLALALSMSKMKELAETRAFLLKSTAVDQQTQSVGQGLALQIKLMFDRVRAEAVEQEALIKKLEAAKAQSRKAKQDARKPKAP